MQDALLKLQMKNKLLHSRRVPVNAKESVAAETPEEREARLHRMKGRLAAETLRREKQDYSG